MEEMISLTEKIKLYHLTNNYEEALKHLSFSLRNKAFKEKKYNLIGLSHYKFSNIEDSTKAFSTSERDYNNKEALLCLAVIYNDIGNYTEGETYFNRCQTTGQALIQKKITPESLAEAHFTKGQRNQEAAFYDKAINEFKNSLSYDSTSRLAHICLSNCYLKTGKYIQAKEALEEFHKKNNPCENTYTLLGLTYYNLNRFELAKKAWEAAFETSEDATTTFYFKFSKSLEAKKKAPSPQQTNSKAY